MFPRKYLAAVVFAVLAAFVLVPAQPASAGTEFNGMINSLRASKGLPALQGDARLDAVAQDWANQMAARGAISHRASLYGAIGGNYSKLGENVGTGGSSSAIFNALVNSPGHYANMVDPAFNRVGTGIARGADGRLYTAHNFGAAKGAAPAPAAAPAPRAAAPKPAAAPRPANAPAPTAKPATPRPAVASAQSSAPAAPASPEPTSAPVAQDVAPAPVAPTPTRLSYGIDEVANIAVQG